MHNKWGRVRCTGRCRQEYATNQNRKKKRTCANATEICVVVVVLVVLVMVLVLHPSVCFLYAEEPTRVI